MSARELEYEQKYVSMLHARVDQLREEAAERLAAALREDGDTPQARVERDAAVARYTGRVTRFDAAENGLCFGRLDLRDNGRYYIGRIGLREDSADDDPLLLDWRAPAARPFYVATAAAPEGVHRRRHITTRGRRVVDLDDEILGDTGAVDRDGGAEGDADGLVGEAALLAALEAGRTGRMRDIVATLQAEQDHIIRSDHRGVLVVQGGPGTGKTAVALHRAAYLLYTHRRLAASGVLVVGPNATFLHYIGQVLPGLGETSVLLATVAELFPGVIADRSEPDAVTEVKGRAVMADVVAAAVGDRQGAVDGPVRVEFGSETLCLEPAEVRRARDLARGTRLPHNRARPLFVRAILDALVDRYTARMEDGVLVEVDDAPGSGLGGLFDEDPDAPLLGEEDLARVRDDLAGADSVHAVLDQLWPVLTPQRLLEELFADPDRLFTAAPDLTDAERDLLGRAPGGGWSPADVPLLDEAAELLGEDTRPAREAAARRHAERIAYAQGVLDIAAGSRSDDPADTDEAETLDATDLLDAERLAERHETRPGGTIAEKAAADRTWTFGHVIVDEAQELSEMAWRVLMRRCPSRSMTVVGDLAQTGDPAGTSSWGRVLEPYVGDRWRLAPLTVNYRTPAEIMRVAAEVLIGLDPTLEPPRSVRESGVAPWRLATTPEALPDTLGEVVAAEAAALTEGRLAVIVPEGRVAELGPVVAAAVPGAAFGADPDLERRVVVLGVRQTKGLEFDVVLVVDPAEILAGAPHGRNDLYVALTRATRGLGVVHAGPAPAEVAAHCVERAVAVGRTGR